MILSLFEIYSESLKLNFKVSKLQVGKHLRIAAGSKIYSFDHKNCQFCKTLIVKLVGPILEPSDSYRTII